MESIIGLLIQTCQQVWATFTHNWPFLVLSVIIAVALKLYVDPNRVSAFLMRYRKAGVLGATAAAVATPLCSCGTTAILLGMMANMMPWAPIIAFMVASPLTSPQELIYSAGLFGWPFASSFFISSILLGLMGGLLGEILERRGWLANQSRFSAPAANREVVAQPVSVATGRAVHPTLGAAAVHREPVLQFSPATACACDGPVVPMYPARQSVINRPQPIQAASGRTVSSGLAASQSDCCTAPAPCACDEPAIETASPACGCGASPVAAAKQEVTWRIALNEAWSTGKRLLVMFLGFAFIGYFINGLIPSEWVAELFGPGNIYSVPLAATLGLPLYINSEASLPLVLTMIDGGMSQGAAMAFLITGAGTSIGAFAGALTIARWRVIAVVIGTLWVGAVVMGFLYNGLLASGLI